MTPKGFEQIIRVLAELSAYQQIPMIHGIITQFKALIPSLPEDQQTNLRLALQPFASLEISEAISTDESKLMPVEKEVVEKLRSILTNIINTDVNEKKEKEEKKQTTTAPVLHYDKRFYDIIFKMQIALAWASPVNDVQENGIYSDDITAEEFTLDDPGLAAASDGVIYLAATLNDYFKLNNAYYDPDFYAARLPNHDHTYRPPISEREKASLQAQGVNILELTPEVRRRIQTYHNLGLSGERIDLDSDFGQQQYFGPVEDFYFFINLSRNQSQVYGYVIGTRIGIAVLASLTGLFLFYFFPIYAALFPSSLSTISLACAVIEMTKGNYPPLISLMRVIASGFAIAMPCSLIAVGLAAYFSIPTVVLLSLILPYTNLIDSVPILLFCAGIISAVNGGSVIDPFNWLIKTLDKCVNTFAQSTFGLCGLGLVKLYQNICRYFTTAEVQLGVPAVNEAVINPEPIVTPNTAGIQRRLQRSRSMPDLSSIHSTTNKKNQLSSTSKNVTDPSEQKTSMASAFSTTLSRSRSMTFIDANIDTTKRNQPSTAPSHEHKASLN